MSAILGVFYTEPRPVDDGLVTRMLDRMRGRGRHRSTAWRVNGAAVGVGRHGWELQEDISGNVCVVDDGDLVIGADASIYYRQDLRRKLAAKGVRMGGLTASHLILAAYRAWGDQCVEYLEGDYAFIVYDRRYRRVFCARDFGGKRPLHYADLGHALVLGSTAAAVLAHPECRDDFNLLHLAEAAGALWQSAEQTPYEAVSLIPAGWSLQWTPGRGTQLQQHWYPPETADGNGPPFEEAAIELRELLQRAVDERLSTSGVTSVWMSGGWDSTAVFGAGQHVLRDRRNQQLHPVSVSYPPGDRGREDELIAAVAGSWEVPVHWLDIRDIPLIDDPGAHAADRDEPSAHAYENFTRALARGSRAIGAHVAFDGNGGDQLFQVSPIFLADLLRTGRWIGLAQEWRALRLTGFRTFFRLAVQPSLPPLLLDAATAIRGGRRLHGTYERWMPAWTNPRIVRTLRERQPLHLPPRRGKSCEAYEQLLYLGLPFLSRMFGIGAGLALEEGIEVRSPLYDGRVVAFAARRPRSDRCSAGETKLLLRRAMRGLLPEHILAPRPVRTGVTSGYFARETRQHFPALFQSAGERWALADLGIVEPEPLARARREYASNLDPDLGLALLSTLHTEWWVRARRRERDGSVDHMEADAALASHA